MYQSSVPSARYTACFPGSGFILVVNLRYNEKIIAFKLEFLWPLRNLSEPFDQVLVVRSHSGGETLRGCRP